MVRIVDERGSVCGAGLLVTPDRVLTCAHVVPEHPFAEFVDPPGGGRVRAARVPGAFFPPSPSQQGDIALLALDTPQPQRATASLRRFPVGRVRQFRAYGFPHADAIGVWAVATLVGKAGPGGEWIQLHKAGGVPVRPGFSGAGVLADPYGHLVGMMVAADPAEDQAFMIPADTIHRYLPHALWITGRSAIDADFAGRHSGGRPDEAVLREVSEFVSGPPGVNIRVVVLGPDHAGRSAALRQAVLAGDRWTDGVDLVVDCAGRTADDVAARIAERAAVEPRHLGRELAPPMTIVLDRVDRAADPDAVLRHVVHPLAERDANRMLVTFDEEHSAALPLAREIEKERSSRHAGQSGGGPVETARERLARARLAERTARSLHRRAGLVIAGLPPEPARTRALRAEFDGLVAGARAGRDVSGGAAGLADAAAEAERAALAARDRLAALLAAHGELRALLTSYQQLSAQYGHAEDAALTALYRRAYALLHDGPADQRAAEAAVDEFAAAVRACRP